MKTAQRRMFSKKITDTDMFLDMPLSTQALYFHLNMNADDDGFVGNCKKVMRMIGASDDDLKVLLAKQFLLSMDGGIVVIKDWRIHNFIRKDTYNATLYTSQKAALKITDTGTYQLQDDSVDEPSTNRRRAVNEPSTQVRLGKVRLDNNTIISDGGVSSEKPASKEHSEDGEKSKLEDDFDKLWKMYPRKVGKKPAFASYKRAVTRKNTLLPTSKSKMESLPTPNKSLKTALMQDTSSKDQPFLAKRAGMITRPLKQAPNQYVSRLMPRKR